MSTRGRRERKIVRTLQPTMYLVVSEGTKTEVNYFVRFARYLEVTLNRDPLRSRPILSNEIVEAHGSGMDTIRVVRHADEIRRQSPNIYASTWAVFDKDDFLDDNFDDAIRFAESLGIQTAWSNEAFEIWFLFHFKPHKSWIGRKQINSKLNRFFKREFGRYYRKNDAQVFSLLLPRIKYAIRNAKGQHHKMLAENRVPSSSNPCTTVYILCEALIGLIDT